MKVLGIAGTAKNTGKTTTTVSIINLWSRHRELAVTSIGYDGESRDNVTGLPKPRLLVPAGALVVTASRCVGAGSAGIEVLTKTDIGTPLGKLVIGRVQKAGLVVMAGPNNERALKYFIHKLEQMGISLLLVDGALGRLAPMSATQGLVLATGASRTTDMDRLARESSAFAALFALPVGEGSEPRLKQGSLLVEKQGEVLAAKAANYSTLEFSGVVDVKPLAALMAQLQPPLADIVVRDPVKLLLSQDLVAAADLLREYQGRGGRVLVRKQLPLKVITVNPFYPDYNEANGEFSPAYLDAVEVHRTIANCVSTPVIDVVRQGDAELAKVLDLQ